MRCRLRHAAIMACVWPDSFENKSPKLVIASASRTEDSVFEYPLTMQDVHNHYARNRNKSKILSLPKSGGYPE
jgi:hypothetical protein